jgi:histidinol dehydrogenase
MKTPIWGTVLSHLREELEAHGSLCLEHLSILWVNEYRSIEQVVDKSNLFLGRWVFFNV